MFELTHVTCQDNIRIDKHLFPYVSKLNDSKLMDFENLTPDKYFELISNSYPIFESFDILKKLFKIAKGLTPIKKAQFYNTHLYEYMNRTGFIDSVYGIKFALHIRELLLHFHKIHKIIGVKDEFNATLKDSLQETFSVLSETLDKFPNYISLLVWYRFCPYNNHRRGYLHVNGMYETPFYTFRPLWKTRSVILGSQFELETLAEDENDDNLDAFRIKNSFFEEYLTTDNRIQDNRVVFTQTIPFPTTIWILEHQRSKGNHFFLRNEYYDEYLYCSNEGVDYHRSFVFTEPAAEDDARFQFRTCLESKAVF